MYKNSATPFLKELASVVVDRLPLCFLPILEIAMDQVPIVSSVISEVESNTESPALYFGQWTLHMLD